MQSEQVNELAAALALARKAYKPLHKSKTAKLGTFSYKYATLDDVYECIGEALAAQGIAIVHQLTWAENVMFLTTRLVHKSGQFFGSVMPIPALGKMQEVGSALTYGKRYQITGLAAIAADEDDDGAAADAQAPKGKKPIAKKEPEPEVQYASPSQAQAFIVAAKAKGLTNEEAKILMREFTGAEHSREIPVDRYEALMDAVKVE